MTDEQQLAASLFRVAEAERFDRIGSGRLVPVSSPFQNYPN